MEKQKAFDLLEIYRSQLVQRAREVAEIICYQKGQVTVDDVRKAMAIEIEEAIKAKIDLRFLGASLGGCKYFIKIGYDQTKINTSHGRPIAVFRLRTLEEL